MSDELRIYIIVRADIEIPPGKAFPQVGHAVLGTYEVCRRIDPERAEAYLGPSPLREIVEGQTKISLKGRLADIERAHREATEMGLPCCKVTDAGRTFFPEPTVTCMAIGPVTRSELPKCVQRLQLYPLILL